MPATPISNPVNVKPDHLTSFFLKATGNDIKWLSVPFGAQLQICQDDIRSTSRYLIQTNNRGLFFLDLSEARQAASPASSPLQQVILRFFTGSGGRTLLGCSYHYPERTQEEVPLEPYLGSIARLIYPTPPQWLHIKLTEDAALSPPSRSWITTGLLTAGGIALALLAAAAWMKKKGMTGN